MMISVKEVAELEWWSEEVRRYRQWYQGELRRLYDVPSPSGAMRIKSDDPTADAIRAFINSVVHSSYPERLRVPKDYFSGKKMLDIGCGPLPLALGFVGCQIYGLDPLLEPYRDLGFPIGSYGARLTPVAGGAEELPFANDSFDAVIAVNAIDHVDDFTKAALEIVRVLRPGGVLRMEVHYHRPNVCEPWCMTDDMMSEHFKSLALRKVHERPAEDGEWIFGEGELLTLWSNVD